MKLLLIFSHILFVTTNLTAAGKHSHGEGSLDIAVQGKKVEIRLVAPLADVVGFEHGARTKKEKQTVEKSIEIFSSPSKFMALDKNCKFNVTDLEGLSQLLQGEDHHKSGHEDHHKSGHEDHHKSGHEDHHKSGHEDHHKVEDHHKSGHEDHHKSGHEDHHKSGHEDHHKSDLHDDKHQDLEARYTVECKSVVEGKALIIKLKDVLPRLKRVKVQLLGSKKATGGLRR